MGEQTADIVLMPAPGISADFADLLIPNVVIELDPEAADSGKPRPVMLQPGGQRRFGPQLSGVPAR